MSGQPQPDATWTTSSDGEYSPERFYTESRDKSGSGHAQQTKLPAETMAQVQAIIEQRRIPVYRTAADFVRDAVHHRLRWLNDNMLDDPRLDAVLERERMFQDALRKEVEHDHYTEMVDKFKAMFMKFSGKQDYGSLDAVLDQAAEMVDQIPEPWSSELWAEVQAQRRRRSKGGG